MKEREYLKELGKKITDSSVRKEIENEYEAHIEANSMIEQNRWDGAEMCSREYAIEMILEDLGCLYE